MKDILNYLYQHKTLSEQQAEEVLTNIGTGSYNQNQIASFLSVFIMRSITIEELSGFRKALLKLCVPVDLSDFDTIDLCGTGGDGKHTFNISTLASFIVAGAGGKVAKHGNYGVSSGCGSSNIMEYFGYEFSHDASKLKKDIEKAGICYMHAQLFHPAMKNVGPVRRDMGVKTFFNLLGPMTNPVFPNKQMVGVFSLEVARLYNYLYQKTDKQYAIIYSMDGYDEVSLTGAFKRITNDKDELISPESLGLETIKPKEIGGGSTVEEAAKVFLNILEGKGTETQNNVALANAAVALNCYYPEKELAECFQIAKESLKSKKALNAFKKLMEK